MAFMLSLTYQPSSKWSSRASSLTPWVSWSLARAGMTTLSRKIDIEAEAGGAGPVTGYDDQAPSLIPD